MKLVGIYQEAMLQAITAIQNACIKKPTPDPFETPSWIAINQLYRVSQIMLSQAEIHEAYAKETRYAAEKVCKEIKTRMELIAIDLNLPEDEGADHA